jgi:2-polyprenyl-3-methyl-5-hydroxy-6-metoxy-1,4-benzoquinol methylase
VAGQRLQVTRVETSERHLQLVARLAVHAHARRAGWRVLEVGAGPGRFTIELAALGAQVVVSDVSTVQLNLNRATVAQAGHAGAILEYRLLDVRDLSAYQDGTFDVRRRFLDALCRSTPWWLCHEKSSSKVGTPRAKA